MSGYGADLGELGSASARLRDTADALAEARLDQGLSASVGPQVLVSALSAFTGEAAAALAATTATVDRAAGALAASQSSYGRVEEDATAAFKRLHP